MPKLQKKEKKEQAFKRLVIKPKGVRRRKVRVGRGSGSGLGTTAGRGSKGQKARAGGGTRPGFEGGQMPLLRRVPKFGFTSPFKKEFFIINLDEIQKKAKDGEVLDIKRMVKYGFVQVANGKKKKNKMIKILGNGEISKSVTVYAHEISKEAGKKILKAGGKIFILDKKVKLDKKVLELADDKIAKKEYKKVA
ncbi:MAG: 50S ribosomal protein L15 [Spirochaetes bacterium]|nr:50S ribosomal protein L15 [Spirochaetota bacterium]